MRYRFCLKKYLKQSLCILLNWKNNLTKMKAQSVKLYVRFLLLTSALRLCAAFDLTILHTNDVHARIQQFNAFGSECRAQDAEAGACFGGEARRMTKVNEIRSQRPNVLLLDGGDRFVGTLWFTQFKGIADSTFMNRFPYDAMVGSIDSKCKR